jgi:hypothetical protein
LQLMLWPPRWAAVRVRDDDAFLRRAPRRSPTPLRGRRSLCAASTKWRRPWVRSCWPKHRDGAFARRLLRPEGALGEEGLIDFRLSSDPRILGSFERLVPGTLWVRLDFRGLPLGWKESAPDSHEVEFEIRPGVDPRALRHARVAARRRERNFAPSWFGWSCGCSTSRSHESSESRGTCRMT